MMDSYGKFPVKVAVVVVVVLVAGSAVVLQPWNWLNPRTVRMMSVVYFQLDNTEDNGPLENVEFEFPDPNIDNINLSSDYILQYNHSIYADTENGLVEEIRWENVIQLVPPRTSNVVVVNNGVVNTIWGPKYLLHLDNFYPRERIEVSQLWEVPANLVDQVTLKDDGLYETGPEPYPTYAGIAPVPAKLVGGTFFAGLYILDDNNAVQQTVEEFIGRGDNTETQSWWALGVV